MKGFGSTHKVLGSNPSNIKQTDKQLVDICFLHPTSAVMDMAEIILLFSKNFQIILHNKLGSTCKSVCPLHTTCLPRSTCLPISSPSISSYPRPNSQVLPCFPGPKGVPLLGCTHIHFIPPRPEKQDRVMKARI